MRLLLFLAYPLIFGDFESRCSYGIVPIKKSLPSNLQFLYALAAVFRPVMSFSHQQSFMLDSARIVTPLMEGSIFFLFLHSRMHAGPPRLLLIFSSLPPTPSPYPKVGQVPFGGGLTK